MIESKLDRMKDTHSYNVHNDWRAMPAMPLRGMVVFPHMLTHLDVGRDRSINAIEEAMSGDKNLIFLIMQKDPGIDEPELGDIYETGVICMIRQLLKLPGGTVRLLVEGINRAKLMSCIQESPYILAEVLPLEEEQGARPLELEAYQRILQHRFEEYAKNSKRVTPETLVSLANVENASELADQVAGQLSIKSEERQQLLEQLSIPRRIETILALIDRESEIVELERTIANRVRQQMEKSQKEYYLREQMKAIQVELGEKDERSAEVTEYRAKAEQAQLPQTARDRFESELRRLEKTPPQIAEAMVITNYLDLILALPWNKFPTENLNIKEAERILAADHYGLEKPKERIIEYLASCQLKNNLKGPIICLVGPPGVGKTSLARSIARATGRKFVRMSLGGVKDEAEIRGHRRTYIGSMPGRLLQSIKDAGVGNPLFLLDEVDKLGNDWRGDPTSALLEALDPEQNSTFSDHYLEIPYDLSKVMFITTANYRANIPAPLQDRMEIIDIPSYTEDEKLHIAERHLIPKQLGEHGIDKSQLRFTTPAVKAIIRNYTREAGVRELERRIAKICRKAGRDIVAGEPWPFKVEKNNVEQYLGVRRYIDDKFSKKPAVGVATGLAWTEVGGELLQVEVQTIPGKGKFTITGKLGDVMKESVQAGYTWLRSQGEVLGIPANIEDTTDFHVHVPEGAVEKDGPSAGITIAAAMTSQLTRRPVRGDIAMTGEITLHGRVLPVGGIKEKLLAAYRNGIVEIILPKPNARDLEELPESIRGKMTFHLVEQMDEVLKLALQ